MAGGLQTYERIAELVERRTGVDIAGHLTGRVRGHVDEQVARLELTGAAKYLQLIDRGGERASALFDDLLSYVLVHETFFYRFESQLRALRTEILPELLERAPGRIRIWSAGCSSGPEPYTLAMIALEAVRERRPSTTIEVLGTDMCGPFLEEARRGLYRADKLGSLPAELRDRYLGVTERGEYEAGQEIRARTRFVKHNLLEPPPATGFSIVSCRNVLMYLRPDERMRTLENLRDATSRDGYLLIGHSESLRDVPALFAPDRRFALGIYRRAVTDEPRPVPEAPAPAAHAAGTAPSRTVGAEPGPEAGRRTHHIRLEGEYDAESLPEKLEALKKSLGAFIDGEYDVVVEADGATRLDQSTARLIARAGRLVASAGGTLVVRASRSAVMRWAERYNLPVDPGGGEVGEA